MLTYPIPGRDRLEIQHLVLDFNGTIAEDGKLIPGVKERLTQLAKEVTIYVITADTNGSVHKECASLPVEVHVIGKEDQLVEKKRFVTKLGAHSVVSIGNGANDQHMFEESSLAIAVIGKEGCAATSLLKSDLIVKTIEDGLDLLLKPHRLTASLRS